MIDSINDFNSFSVFSCRAMFMLFAAKVNLSSINCVPSSLMLAALSHEFSGFSKCLFTKSYSIKDCLKSFRKLGYES
jgi:hypothetical protein